MEAAVVMEMGMEGEVEAPGDGAGRALELGAVARAQPAPGQAQSKCSLEHSPCTVADAGGLGLTHSEPLHLQKGLSAHLATRVACLLISSIHGFDGFAGLLSPSCFW